MTDRPAPGDLRVDVLRADDIHVLSPVGQLNMATAPDLRRRWLKSLADSPRAVLLDLRELQAGTPAALTLFGLLSRDADTHPEVELAVCGAAGEVARTLRRLRRHTRLAVAEPQDPRALCCLLPDSPTAPAVARVVTARAGAGDLAQLVASELVTYAALRVPGPLRFELARRRSIIELTVAPTAGAGPPRHPGLPEDAADTLLLLLTSLGSGWGVRRGPDGAPCWWAAVDIEEAR